MSADPSSSERTLSVAEEQPLLPAGQDGTVSSRKEAKVSVLTLSMIILLICLSLFGVFKLNYDDSTGTPSTFYDDIDADLLPREIMLFGDSLVGVPDEKYNMGEELEKDVEKKKKEFDVTISVSSEGGNKAQDLYNRVDSDVIHRHDKASPPNAVIVLFDSDAADVDEGDKADVIRESYEEKLDALLGKLTAKVRYVALSGPILDGERKEGDNEKDDQLDAYEKINKKVSLKHQVAYIDLRKEFQHEENGYSSDEGHLTVDGEHPKAKGTEIIEKAFLKQILSWEGLWSKSIQSLLNYKAPEYLKSKIDELQARYDHNSCVESLGAKGCEEYARIIKEKHQAHLDVLAKTTDKKSEGQ